MSNIMQSIANSLPPHMSPVKITFTKPSTQTTNTSTQKVIIVTTSPSSTFVPNILSKSHNYAAVTKLVPTSAISAATQKQPVVIPSPPQSSVISSSNNGGSALSPSSIAVTTVVSSTPSLVMSTVAQGLSTSVVKVASSRLPSPKSLVASPSQILAQFPKQYQQSPKPQLHQIPQQAQPASVAQQVSAAQCQMPPGIKHTMPIKQESVSGVKIITQQMQPSKILPKPMSATLPNSGNSPIMVVSSNGAIMTTKLVTTPSGTQATYTRPALSSTLGARMAATPGATYVKTTSGSIITVVPKSLASLGGKIISSNIVSAAKCVLEGSRILATGRTCYNKILNSQPGTTTKITTIPMTSKPNVIVVQKTTGKGTTIQGLPGKNVVTTLLNAGGEKALQAMSAGTKPAIITATRPITKMIVTQPKGMGSAVQQATKIIPTKIVYGQQGKTQVLIKPKPMTFQAAMMSEQTRQLVTETLQQASRVVETTSATIQEVKEDPQSYTESSSSSTESSQSSQGAAVYMSTLADSQPVVHVIASRGHDWSEHEIAMETSPTIIYQDLSGESQSATSTIKAIMELQQTTGKSRQVATTTTVSAGDVPLSSLLHVTHPSQHHHLQPSQTPRTLLQHVTQSQTAAQTSVVVKSIPTSSSGAITHIMQQPLAHFIAQALSSHAAFTKRTEETVTEEGEVEEMDTLDPQTGLFYRSALAQKQQKQIHLHQEGGHLHLKTVQSLQTKQKQIIQLQPEQIQHKIQQTAQLSFRQQKITPLQQEHLQQHTQRHVLVKERHFPSMVTQPQQTVVQVLAVKTTQQLPKLQQVQSQHKIYMQSQLSHPQMQLPVSSEKQPATQVPQPIVTQGSAVTKITFEGRHPPTVSKTPITECLPKLTQAVTSILPRAPVAEKPSVADILKMSMMEADIDTNVEHMIVDPPSKVTPIIKPMPVLTEASIPSQVPRLSVPSTVTATVPPPPKCFPAPIITAPPPTTLPVPLPPPPPLTRKVDVPVASQVIQIQNVPQKAEEVPSEIIIQTIPQYSIPCHSSSNVVVEPSGLLEMNNFTSQMLVDEDTVIAQDGDSTEESSKCKPPLNIQLT
ncbi:hypothetical protein FKM82_009875 [Ascaphus truei]